MRVIKSTDNRGETTLNDIKLIDRGAFPDNSICSRGTRLVFKDTK